MKRFRIEIQIALLALIIGLAVIAAGFLVYRSMSQIVASIHREARPDNRLFMVKDIAGDLAALENKARLYILTDDEEDLSEYDTLVHHLAGKLDLIKSLPVRGKDDMLMTDSLREFALEKQGLWQGILSLHQKAKGVSPTFTKIYSKLDQQKTDTITVKSPKKGFLRRIFGSKKSTMDTTYTKHALESEEVKREIHMLESEIIQQGQNINETESRLIKKNIVLTAKLNNLVAEAEKKKTDEFIGKSQEVDRLANLTYKKLAAFTAIAVVLLLFSLYILFSYLRKSRAYQDALQDARQKAENLAHAKEQFAANVSHELRTPVNAIYGLTEQTLQRELDPETKELLTVISKSSRHLKNIINDTLDFSKIEADKIVLEKVNFQPDEICIEVLSIHEYEARRKGISLNFIKEGEVPAALLGDPLRLKQVLINLVSNAVKFTDKGSVSLALSAEKMDDNHFWMTFAVEDTGIGIRVEDLDKIFEEFVQAGTPGGKKYSGTGLGLSISRKLIEMQGGRIDVQSEPGKGTRVAAKIPFQKGHAEDLILQGQEERLVPASFQKIAVLIADDDEYNSYLLKHILKKWGVAFDEVKNGREATDAAGKNRYDIILMDMHMPEMNGAEAARIIKGNLPDAKIVAVSASNDPGDRMECKKAGMEYFLSKPFPEKELFDILKNVNPSRNDDKNVQQQPASIAELNYLANGDRQFLQEMVVLFIKTTGTAMENMEKAIAGNDMQQVFENAHKIAASCRQIKADKLYKLIKQLEEKSRKGENQNTVQNLFLSVKAEMTEVHAYLENCKPKNNI